MPEAHNESEGLIANHTINIDGKQEASSPQDGVPIGKQEADGVVGDTETQSPPRQIEADGGGGGGLVEQALMAILGNNYKEKVGRIIAFIGLGTVTSTIGGLFTRGPPVLLHYITDPENADADDTHALILYYMCLPAFFVLGLLEMCYGIWVNNDEAVRAGKLAKTILIVAAILLVVTICFTGAGVSV